jgi:Neuraminidase (sialidase)
VDTNANSPFKNALYVSVTQFAFNNNSEISVSHSIDGGNTWSTVAVDTQQTFPKVDQFSDLAVGADGAVYVNWLRCRANGPSGDCGGTTANLMFSKSTDGGVTWSTPIVATTTALVTDPGFCCFYGQLPNTSERVSNIPANAVRGSGATARVSMVYYDWTGTQMQVKVATSNDGGTTWGAGVRANTSNAGDQFFPWLNVAKNGRLGVTWLDRRNDPANLKYQPFFAFSNNGGTSFSNSHALSSTPSDPTNDGFGGGFMGDYTGNAWNGKALYASWMDTRSGTCQDEVGGVQF